MSTIVLEGGSPRSLLGELRRVVQHRDLLLLLTQKDLKLKYKGTALGFVWSFLNPLLMMIVYATVFSVIARVQMTNYPVFLLAGMLPWNAFIISISTSSMSILGNANLIRRVNFPREFLPLATVLSSLVNLALSLVILFVFALAFRQPLGLPLLALPAVILLQLVLTSGLALILASLMVYFRDVENLITLATTVLFFATPIIYRLQDVHHRDLQVILGSNPLAWMIGAYQAIWHQNSWPDLHQMLPLTAVSVLSLVAGWMVFRRLEGNFAEEV
jgi:lipopolysaccharide transport system permease protein